MFSSLLHFFGLVFTRCYGDYGCYSLGGDFYTLSRPINVFPMKPEVINSSFLLYNRHNYVGERIYDYNNFSSLASSSFCKTCETKIIIHGFIESTIKPWVKALSREMLRYDDYNVVIVDWRAGALPPYTQAVANARIMGAVISKFIHLAQRLFNISTESIHIIGHSLGGHVAGYVGQEVRGIGRITGLDPAKPFFEMMAPDVRLDSTDANFVDVIHTDTGFGVANMDGFGMYEPVGHVDFYPNGGITQTGCKDGFVQAINRAQGKLTYELKEYLMCNHKRSYMYFMESVNSDCPMLSVRCDSWENYRLGNCFDCQEHECFRMGFHADRGNYSYIKSNRFYNHSDHKYYLTLGSRRPYCKYHYLLSFEVVTGFYGRLTFTLVGKIADTWKILFLNREMQYASSTSYSYVFGERDIGNVTDIVFQWEAVRRVFKPYSWFLWRKPTLAINNIHVRSLETDERTGCSTGTIYLKNNVEHSLHLNENCLNTEDAGFDFEI